MSDELPEVHGVNAKDFAQWRQNPVTKALHKYLVEAAMELEAGHIARWKEGRMDEDLETEARGRVLMMTEFVTLEFDDVLSFYHEEIEEDEGKTTEQD